jgi:formylglycine-generating enzyme required for sulfatase activity
MRLPHGLRVAAHLLLAVTLLAGCMGSLPATRKSELNAARDVAASLEMLQIPAGRFVMGTDPAISFQNGFPPHEVTVPAFRLARYPITFEQFDAFARATRRALPTDEGWGRGRRPAIHVSWLEAQTFVAWLNAGTGRHFRLATEAEFEYAARGGTTTLYWWGDEPNPNMANSAANSGRDVYPFTAPVDAFPPNPFGLHDMSGNVWQMTEDCRHGSYENAPTDGSAWTESLCDGRVVRGGGFGGIRRALQSAARAATGETFNSAELGFRLAESL